MLHQVCPNCEQTLQWEEVNLSNNSWKCGNCQNTLPLLETILYPDQLQYKAKIKTAKGIHIKNAHPLLIKVTPKAKGNAWLFLLIGLLLLWFSVTITAAVNEKATATVDLSFYLFMGVLALIGLALLYLAVRRMFVNHWIEVKTNQLVTEGRLLGLITLRKVAIAKADIQQVFVQSEEELNLKDSAGGDQTRHAFQLLVRRQDGTDLMLLMGLRQYQAAFLLETQIEQALGITDERLPEEFIPWTDLAPGLLKSIGQNWWKRITSFTNKA